MNQFFRFSMFFIGCGLCIALFSACESSSGDDDDGDGSGTPTRLEINPSSLSINTQSPQTIVFSVDGGVPPYSWSVSDGGLGTIDGAGDQVLYESTTATGANVITARDSADNVGTVVIDQL